jgi:signal transduction histidine kinase
MSNRLSTVINPSLDALEDFNKMMVESKMYSTNWVFLRYKQEDKESLKMIHDKDYIALKKTLNGYTANWVKREWVDSLNIVFSGFEELLGIEKNIMNSLKAFADYDDPVIKLEAERQVEEEILPRTAALLQSLNGIQQYGLALRTLENDKLESASATLRMFIIILTITIILAGILLARYMTRVIIRPINSIRKMLNDLGKGVTRRIEHSGNNDEISKMAESVNSLSGSLQATATFAQEIGLRNFDMPFMPLSDEDTLGKALLTMRDNLRTSEHNLEMQRKELERQNKELEQFAYVASHDLQEPLRTTSSFVDLLQQQYKGKLDEKADKYLDYIIHASGRMRVLITDLLEYSRIGAKKELQEVDCNAILNDVLTDLGQAIKETNADIITSSLPNIIGYPTEIKLLFQNLIFNAIKFRRKNVAPRIWIQASRKGHAWQFSFADNGIGIAKEHNERIFIIFQRLHTRSEYSGSGIGLSHCKKIVELHKGRIWLDSELGKGSTFYFTIPQNIISLTQRA